MSSYTCILLALVLCSCSVPVRSGEQSHAETLPLAASLPALPIDRTSSETVSTQLNGSEFLLKASSAAVDGMELELFSTLQDPSWGIWQLTPGNARLVEVQALMNIPAGKEAWIAVANYSTNRWDITGPTGSSLTVGLHDGEHLSEAGNAHVAVIAAAGDSLNVVRLILTTDRVGWQYAIYDDGPLAGVEPVPLQVDGKPAIAYLKSITLDTQQLWFAYSSTVTGINTEDWTSVFVYQANLALTLDAAVVNGNPAIVCREQDPDRLIYFRSVSADGQQALDWPAPVEVSSGPGVGWNPALAVTNGKPSIAYNNTVDEGIFYAHSNDAFGDDPADWYVDRVLQADQGEYLDIAEVSANPAVAYSDGPGSLSYRRSAGMDGDGFDDWFGKVIVDEDGYLNGNPVLLMADGNPAIVYVSSAPNTILFRRSSTANGGMATDWDATAALESAEIFQSPDASLIAGRPAVCYITLPAYDIVYRRSSSTAGVDGTWTHENVGPGLDPNIRGGLRMTEVAGRPVVCWYEPFGDRAYYSTYID